LTQSGPSVMNFPNLKEEKKWSEELSLGWLRPRY